eukprot:scaffold790_cov119-Amphora_coffeaeformis.AAC.2
MAILPASVALYPYAIPMCWHKQHIAHAFADMLLTSPPRFCMLSPRATDGGSPSVGPFWGKTVHLRVPISLEYLQLTTTEKNVEIGPELTEILDLTDSTVTTIFECIEVRLKASDFDRISAAYEVIVITPETKRRPFTIPIRVQRAFGYTNEFQDLLKDSNIRAIDHGEFQRCADKLVSICGQSDMGTNRRAVVCLQRCRRGGKTFMSTAVASRLEMKFEGDNQAPFVIFISMNSTSKLSKKETAMNAILSRIAFVLDNSNGSSFYEFLKRYSNFDAIIEWVEKNKVILLIDELNIIEPSRAEYERMSLFLDALVGRKGSALLYTTHHRLEENLRQGREDEDDLGHLSARPHCWQPMPRLKTKACIRHMRRTEHFWSAVLRGRIPALLVLEQHLIKDFMPEKHQDDASRCVMFNAILDGDIEYLEAGRKNFRAYSYLLSNEDGDDIHVWPPFLCAQKSVLGKNCPNLRATLEAPDTNP